MDIRQGNTIKFISVFKTSSESNSTSWNDIDNVIIYAYTCKNYIVKFSLLPMPGYNQLTKIDSTHLLGAITPQQSKLMIGELMMEMCIIDNAVSVLDGGDSSVLYNNVIDGGTSNSMIYEIIDGGSSETYDPGEVGINAVEVGITIVESAIKNEV